MPDGNHAIARKSRLSSEQYSRQALHLGYVVYKLDDSVEFLVIISERTLRYPAIVPLRSIPQLRHCSIGSEISSPPVAVRDLGGGLCHQLSRSSVSRNSSS
jgi:hypothetical protein